MNQEIKEKWIAALRSGKYQQGVQCLKSKSGYCCLGVLADIYSKEKGIPWENNNMIEDSYYVLPATAVEWADLKSDNPTVMDDRGGPVSLAHLNDVDNYTFKQIADVIERDL